jgi:transposase
LHRTPKSCCGWCSGWRDEATKAGRSVSRIAVAFEAGRDGFWLARWLRARGIEAHVIQASSVAVSREHRRAKTDRRDVELLDVERLKRAFLGWLRGARDHCKMAAIPTLELADARRPSRERETLVGERTRITNRMKSTLARLGIGNFKPNLRKAPERLGALRTPQGVALPANTMAELQRDMTRLQLVKQQIAEIEQMQLTRLAQPPTDAAHGCPPRMPPMRCSSCWRASSASASRPPTCWSTRCSSAICATAEPWRGMPV